MASKQLETIRRILESKKNLVEQTEQIDELSSKTLRSYADKAKGKNQRMLFKNVNLAARYSDEKGPDKKEYDKRSANITRAYQKANGIKPKSQEELKAKLADLKKDFDPSYDRSDDHSYWSKHDAIKGQMDDIKRQIKESESLDELSPTTLDSYAEKARKNARDTSNKSLKQKNLQRAYDLSVSAAKRSANAAKAENKSRVKKTISSWGVKESSDLDEAIVVHSSKEKDGKEYQVLSRKAGIEFVIQSKKKDGTWHTHDSVGSSTRAKQLIVTGRYSTNESVEESLDSPLGITRNTSIDVKKSYAQDPDLGITDRKMYDLGDGSKITTFTRASAVEIHHISKDGTSNGKVTAGPINTEFVATLYKMASALISSGKKVRIIMLKGEKPHYLNIAMKLAKKHNYHVSPVSQYDLELPRAKYFVQFTINENTNLAVADFMSDLYESVADVLMQYTQADIINVDYAKFAFGETIEQYNGFELIESRNGNLYTIKKDDQILFESKFKGLQTKQFYSLSEATKVPSVNITIPALIRLCEIAKEEIDSDTDLHEMIEALIEHAAGGTIDSDMIEKIEGDGDSDEDDMNEQFVVLDHNKKPVHVAYSQNEAKAKAVELTKSTGKQHTATFKREATVPVKEGQIVSADRKVGKDGRLYPAKRKIVGPGSNSQ